MAALNADITSLPSLGPYSKYEVAEERVRGKLELSWIGEVGAPERNERDVCGCWMAGRMDVGGLRVGYPWLAGWEARVAQRS